MEGEKSDPRPYGSLARFQREYLILALAKDSPDTTKS